MPNYDISKWKHCASGRGKLQPLKYELANLGNDQVDIKGHYCGFVNQKCT